jgi:CheY-like chemotaxis protein
MSTSGSDIEAAAQSLILVAEDDPDQSDMLSDSLRTAGYGVETVFSGDVALRRLSERTYVLAIMDARMPGLQGGEVLRLYRALNRQPATAVIMVSAFVTPQDMEKYKRDGAIASFSKPLNVPRLLNFLKNVTYPN